MLLLLFLLVHKPIDLPIYTPLLTRHVTTSPSGVAYVLDRDNARILPFSPAGMRLPPIASKGDGPGELRYPYSIAWVEDRLVIQDQHGLNLFSQDGRFTRRIPASQEMLAKTQKGMIGAGYTFANQHLPKEVGVFSYDEAGHRSRLFTVSRAKHGSMTESYQSTRRVSFVPASARIWMLSSADGRRIYYFPGSGQHIHVIDGSSHQLLDPIRLPVPLRVNKQWAEHAFQQHMAKITRKITFDVRLSTPNRYPALRAMNLIGNSLYVVCWSRAPDRDFPVLAFSPEGVPTTARYGGHQVARIAGVVDDRVWLIGWNSTNENANIALVASSELDDFISVYPSPFSDWKQ